MSKPHVVATCLTLAALAATALPPTAPAVLAQAPQQELGTIAFPTSGSAAAQDDFIRGVLLLHSFEYEPAAEAFRAAQQQDPDFAMAYWGEAMSYNHPLWAQQDRDAALETLERLAPTPEERAAKAGTPKERDWLGDIEALYGGGGGEGGGGEGDKYARDFAYRDAMRRMYEAYPDDNEVAAFYALSLLGTSHDGRDFSIYMRAAAIVDRVFASNPDHPGAAHILIHSFDDPVHAPLGLPAARAYSGIAPAASHAQHMTSHIFVAMGMWDDVVTANEMAREVQDAQRAEQGLGPNGCGHYNSWLQYGYLQQGRIEAAEAEMDLCHRTIAENGPRAGAGYYASMRARFVLDTQRWGGADHWTADLSGMVGPKADYDFTTGFAAFKEGDLERAREMAEELRSAAQSDNAPASVGILALELDALLMIADGRAGEGVEALERATFLEENMPFEFGPPAVIKPSHELLGEVLLELGRTDEAVEAFQGALSRAPRRTASLAGLAHAADAAGDAQTAAEARAELQQIWRHADEGFAAAQQER
jgi:tetratricopeptide (TPR) repeat protein